MSSPDATMTTAGATESVGGGEAVGVPSLRQAASGLAAALGQGAAVAREVTRLSLELGRIAWGRSDLAPAEGDRRFTDPAWTSNPAFRMIQQSYLASARALDRVVGQLGDGGSDTRAEQARFAAGIVTSAAAPTNYLVTNPAALKRAFDTGGMSLVRGARNVVHDVRRNGGMPSTTQPGAFEVGRDLAVTPGAVVARDAVAELLQYDPATDTVFQRPVLIVPPPIGRYYFLDLRPGRSFVEYAVGRGLQTFMLSWRNPTAEQGSWDLDTYADAVSAAIDTVRQVTGSPDVNVIGFCAGGIIATALLNHLTATGDQRVHSMSYAVTLLDFGLRAPITAFSGRGLISLAGRRSRRAGIITSRQMGSAFTWLRPDDLVFNYWVNNYLMGEQPPAFDILAWNADGTNLPGALHGQFLDIFRDNLLARPGQLSALGTRLELENIKLPTFVTGAVTDHLTPWKGCYRTTQLLGGPSTFVLSYSGHIASLVNPPGNPKAHYWTGGVPGEDPEQWLAGAEKQRGSWWEAWAEWATARSGDRRPRPETPGSERYPVLAPAPGLYVRDMVPA
ncbi:MAG TPA: alpha/beta fold hydrolase [Streptosporangiaceae bacterium]|nr:alpha/beta fold hydrolase [Streptosporangiaceae bacterium]